jgi:predicted nucleic acid-binding protein
MAFNGEIQLVVSNYVLKETRRNLESKSTDDLLFLDFVLDNLQIELVKPTKAQVLAAAKHVDMKDAPIIAAAKKARVDLLVTLDQKHLLGRPELAKYSDASIVTPREAVAYLKQKN